LSFESVVSSVTSDVETATRHIDTVSESLKKEAPPEVLQDLLTHLSAKQERM